MTTLQTRTYGKKTLNKARKQTTRRGSVVWLACGPDPWRSDPDGGQWSPWTRVQIPAPAPWILF